MERADMVLSGRLEPGKIFFIDTEKGRIVNDDEIKKINDVIVNPKDYKVPSWMLNRRKDLETGQDRHLISADLTFSTDNDIKMQKMIRSYKGVRHILGQPVRGQRTKSNFRKNKGKVHLGVKTRPGAKSGRT